MSTEIEIRNPNLPQQAEAFGIEEVKQQVQLIQQLMHGIMQKDEHYGVIPGTRGKPTLLKAGAEKLSHTFRLVPEYVIETINMDGGHREYIVRCRLLHAPTGRFQGEGVGSCSTMEKKYRYRSEWANGKKSQVENPDIADTYNTVLKMAKKRSHVDAILTATAASDIFTQDLEDMPREEAQEQPKQARKPAGDGQNGAPPELTWEKKTEMVKAKLHKAVGGDGAVWMNERNKMDAKTRDWPAKHREEVHAYINELELWREENATA